MNYYELRVASVNTKILCHKIAQLNSIIRIMAFSNISCHRFSVDAANNKSEKYRICEAGLN